MRWYYWALIVAGVGLGGALLWQNRKKIGDAVKDARDGDDDDLLPPWRGGAPPPAAKPPAVADGGPPPRPSSGATPVRGTPAPPAATPVRGTPGPRKVV